jgi:hypothetical protein
MLVGRCVAKREDTTLFFTPFEICNLHCGSVADMFDIAWASRPPAI